MGSAGEAGEVGDKAEEGDGDDEIARGASWTVAVTGGSARGNGNGEDEGEEL